MKVKVWLVQFYNKLLYRVFIYALFIHLVLLLTFFSFFESAVKLKIDVNQIPVDLVFRVDYSMKKVPYNKLNRAKKKSNKAPISQKASKAKVSPKKSTKKSIAKKETAKKEPEKSVAKKAESKKEATQKAETKKIEEKVKPEKKTKSTNKEEQVKQQDPDHLQDNEAIIGREDLEELKIKTEVLESVQKYWQPPKNLNVKQPSKWLLIIDFNGKKNFKKISSSGVLAFDLAARKTLMAVSVKLKKPVEVEISFS